MSTKTLNRLATKASPMSKELRHAIKLMLLECPRVSSLAFLTWKLSLTRWECFSHKPILGDKLAPMEILLEITLGYQLKPRIKQLSSKKPNGGESRNSLTLHEIQTLAINRACKESPNLIEPSGFTTATLYLTSHSWPEQRAKPKSTLTFRLIKRFRTLKRPTGKTCGCRTRRRFKKHKK